MKDYLEINVHDFESRFQYRPDYTTYLLSGGKHVLACFYPPASPMTLSKTGGRLLSATCQRDQTTAD